MKNKYTMEILKEIETIKEVFNEPIKIMQPQTKEYNYIRIMNVLYRTLRQCYTSYSGYKEWAYNKYLGIYSKLFEQGFAGIGFGVHSYNTMQFTLIMILSKNNITYKIFITKSYNRIIAYKEA